VKIYFAGSIRAGRENAATYSKIIEYLRKFGSVLTEHVGNPTLTSQGESLPEKEIYLRDLKLLAEADIIIAELSTPSLGVGYEIRAAEELGKPVICLYRHQEGKRLSTMIEGNSKLTIIKYETPEDLLPKLDKYLTIS